MSALALPPDRVAGTAIVAESFESFQGEGPLTGQRCAFCRFSRCNLNCSWCDTKYTWDWSQYEPTEVSRRVPVPELVDWIAERAVDLVVITGGEPMLQQPAMTALAAGVNDGVRVQVETNGTQAPVPALAELVDLWVVSPKLANSGVDYSRRIVPHALDALCATGRAVFKFVVTDHATDFDEISRLADDFELNPIWVVPEGDTREKVLAGMDAIYDPAVERGWNLSTRLHVLTGAR
ncbi:7-carboxy-7-deazaguanine synthase QueE [Amycolatopsis pigmentata]|uniref:7-carboxy-7-deazaguanine synthase n=1 Tax=Amycolatopsis pigmentata TaxID=450801 RepID=A0ABW5G708_9PSEU